MSDGPFNSVSPALKNVLREFASNRLEIILAIAFAVLLVVGSIMLFLFQKRRARRRKKRESQEIRQRVLSRVSLDPSEEDLLDKLMRRVANWRIKGHSVLLSKGAFDSAVRKLMGEEGIPDQEVARLRIKLGLTDENLDKIIHSTTSLPPDTQVLLGREGLRAYARVVKSESNGLVISIAKAGEKRSDGKGTTSKAGFLSPKPGDPVTVYFKTPTGTFHFETNFLKVREARAVLAHSESIRQIQRRRYYRSKVNLPAWVKTLDSEEERRKTRIENLSGGGAKLVNPGGYFQKGSEIEITFRTESAESYSLSAIVERLSGRGRYLHVSFEQIGESTRDKLVNYVLMQRRKTQ